ncbi:MAG: hypothetical protein ABIC40_03295, partial [bacterium]
MQNVLSLIKGFLYEMGGQLAPEAFVEENLLILPSAEPRTVTGDFYEIPDGPGRPMGIQLFQTGRSHTYLIGTIQTEDDVRPVHYSSVASAILHRTNGLFTPYSRPIVTDLIILDLTGIRDEEVMERYGESIEIIDIGH